ncbi:MAG TPA: hypothetical protein VF171_06560 [Trueperaceae bacterium]
MKWQQIERNWDQLKDDAKQAWPHLTEAELEVVHGQRDKLVDKVRDREHMSHEAAQMEVDSWQRSLR